MIRFLACALIMTAAGSGVPLPDSLLRIGAGGWVGAAVHDASFGSLPGVPSCCSSYGSKWHTSWGIAGIVERPLVQTTPLPLFLQLRLGLQNMNGRLQRDEFIANVIVGDRVTRGISRYQLDATLWAVSLEPLLRVELPAHRQLGFDAGMRLDWYALASYAQREDLVSPPSGAVFETGTRTRNVVDGTIPTHALFGAAIQLGASYSIPTGEGWILRPEVRGQLALSRIADVPWRVHRILGGISFLRGIEPPHQQRLPQPTEPPTLPPLVLYAQAQLLGVRYSTHDTAVVEIGTRRIHQRELVPPVVFFAAGSASLDSAARQHLARIAHVAQRRGLTLRLAPSTAPDEPDSLRLARARAVRRELQRWNVAIADTTAVAPSPRTIPPAIADELRAVWIATPAPLIEEHWQDVPITEPTVALRLVATVEPQRAQVWATVTQNGAVTSLQLDPSLTATVQLSPAPLLNGQSSHISWHVGARDSMGRTAEQRGIAIMTPIVAIHDTVINSVTNGDLLMLGRCSFDAVSFDEFDTVVAAYVQRALQEGRRVTFIGMTDAIGTESYNRSLARRRAEAARQLLKLNAEHVRIEERIGGTNRNDSLYGRLANRGVLVRIEPP